MLPALPYKPGVYPPPGDQWPTYGNFFLKKAMSSVSQDAHNAMVEKKEEKRKVLVSRLPRHGFAVPRPPPQPAAAPHPPPPSEHPPPPPPPAQGPQFFSIATSDIDQGTQTEPTHAAGQSTQTEGTYITSQGMQTEPVEQQFASSSSKLHPKKTVKKTSVKRVVKKTAAEVPSAPKADAGIQTQSPEDPEDDKATVNYGSDIADNEEMPGRASQKRPAEVKKEAREKKPRTKTEPQKRPGDVIDEPKKKPKRETAKVKQEGAPPQTSIAAAEAPVPTEEDHEVQTTGVSFNNNTDVDFWRQQSANELRAQLNLRFPDKRGDWNLKSKAQLVSIVRGLIKKGAWQQGSSAAPARTPAAASTAEDDEVKLTNINVNRTTDMDFWAHQSMNEIRQQIALRTPHNRSQWAFLKRPELMAYIQGMMRDGTW